jgi:hypothetical protein
MADAVRARDARLTDKIGIGVLTRLVNRDLVDEVLADTGRLEKRSRLLPARVVVYYVMALTLFHGEAYEEVMRRLVGGLKFLRAWRSDWQVPTTGAISQARARLGEEPLAELFDRVARPLAGPGESGCWYDKWRVMAADGVVLDVVDNPANDAAFGRMSSPAGPNPFPQVRVVGIAESGTHAVIAASMGPVRTGERELLTPLLDVLEEGMLLLADRGFYSYDLWNAARERGTELLWRVLNRFDLPVHERLPDGSYRSTLLPAEVRANLKRRPRATVPAGAAVDVRVIEYSITNRGEKPEVVRLITSLTDYDTAPAAELAGLYAQRWEFEQSLSEIETRQLGQQRVLRSKTPELVRQEIWALLLTHYAIRALMHEAADDIDIDPDRLSFIRSLRVIRRQVTDQAAFSPQSTEQSNPTHHR